jgi:hypothetical protein
MLRALLTTLVATAVGGAAYAVWLSAFLLLGVGAGGVLEAALWLMAPAVSAAGFAAGMALVGRPWERRGFSLRRVFLWPLVGCTIGAAAAWVFGPRLIVFGILAGGALSVAILGTRSMAADTGQ